MQPTFIPWIGYMAMIDTVDEFVFLDSVQFAKRTWQQRNKIKTSNGEHWISIPVKTKDCFSQNIKDAKIVDANKSLSTILKTIKQSYAKAPYFQNVFEILEKSFVGHEESICTLNINIISNFANYLQMDTLFSRSSKLKSKGVRAELLSEICLEKGYTTYLSATGSREYIEESDAFQRKSIEVIYHEFEHPVYDQLHSSFVPYLGFIDMLFNHNSKDSLEIIRKACV
jgi:hypothetical protein